MSNTIRTLMVGLAIGMVAGAMIAEADSNTRKLIGKGRKAVQKKIESFVNETK